MLDLHEHSALVARVVVAATLDDFRAGRLKMPVGEPLLIVTGQGRRSEGGSPVLKPAIVEMLGAPEYARLGAFEAPANPGRLCIPAAALREWAASPMPANTTPPPASAEPVSIELAEA